MIKLPADLDPANVVAICDTREQTPLDLSPLRVIRTGLHVGDYSLAGLESVVAVERKSLPDLLAGVGRERDRFQRELDALRGWPVSAVVIEASWRDLDLGDWRSSITPKQVRASCTSWIAQGHRIVMAHDHAKAAEIVRDILFFAARYRWREARALVGAVIEAKEGAES